MNTLLAHLLKLKKVYFIVFLLFIMNGFLAAQKIENDSTSLLTSVIWKSGKDFVVIYKFNADGTFFSTFLSTELLGIQLPPMDSMGKWEWIRHDTFTMQTTQKIVNGEFKELNPEPYHKKVVRILKIDNRILQGITHNILVTEDSEYAFQFDWYVKN